MTWIVKSLFDKKIRALVVLQNSGVVMKLLHLDYFTSVKGIDNL